MFLPGTGYQSSERLGGRSGAGSLHQPDRHRAPPGTGRGAEYAGQGFHLLVHLTHRAACRYDGERSMKIRDWTTLGAMALGAAGTGFAVKSLLPENFATEQMSELSLIHISEPTRLGMISYAV